jgi:hypothetical protein
MSVTFLLRNAGIDMTEDTCPLEDGRRPPGRWHAAAYSWLMMSAASLKFPTI